ncbi:MAG: AsmA-like C-terminal region-containing protein, partial [Fibrobacter sp.]|nr:AsmA-like C-terminal region-containing protein [Fibrobacter sp.]
VASNAPQGAGNSIPPLILPGLDMKGTVNAAKIIYDGIHMDKLNMTVAVVKDIADMTFSTGFSKGTISDNMHIDLRNTQNIKFTNKLAVKSIEVNELLKSFGGFVKPTTPLNRELINLQKSLYGKVNLDCNLAGNGGTSEELMKTLNGKLTAKVDNGKISNSLILKKISKNVEKFIDIDDINFRNLSTTLLIADERVTFEEFSIKSDFSGDWGATGSVGFDAGLDIGITDKLTKSMSSKVLSVQSSGKNALKGLLKGTQLASAASNLIDNAGIPSDKDGRVTIKLALRGTASDPDVSFAGFGDGDNSTASTSKDAKTKAVEDVKATLNQKKQELQAKANEERRKAEEELKKKAQEQKAVVNKEVKKQSVEIKKQAEDAKKKAVGKLKKLF